MNFNTTLCELFYKHKLDRIGIYKQTNPEQHCHPYSEMYYSLLKDQHVKNMLEIGIGFVDEHNMRHMIHLGYKNGASTRAWKEFFPEATIHAIDTNPNAIFFEDRIKTYVCNQSDTQKLDMFFRKSIFELIIDDGSHKIDDQLRTFNCLRKYMAINGIYIIESVQEKDFFLNVDLMCSIIPTRDVIDIRDNYIIEFYDMRDKLYPIDSYCIVLRKRENNTCVCCSYFGEADKIDISENVPKIDYIDYYLFTNLKPDQIKVDHPYQVITVNIKANPNLKNLPTNVHVSRYFKFQLHNALKHYTQRDYNFVFYLDHYLYLRPTIDWNQVVRQTLKHKSLKIVQHIHTFKNSIATEMDCIVDSGKDTRENIELSKEYLNKYAQNYDFDEIIRYVENDVFGFSTKDMRTLQQFDLFWIYYVQPLYKTYRDQPLWNFLYDITDESCLYMALDHYVRGGIKNGFNVNRYNILTQD